MIDNVIIEKIKQQDEQGFSMLLDHYSAYVSAILINLSRGALQQEDIEELAADVFIAVWRSREAFQAGRPLKPYIAQIARNAVFSCLRRNIRETIPFDDDILVFSKEGRPDEAVLRREQRDIINEAVERFTELDREIFVRFYFYGESVKAIAEKLNRKSATVKTKLHRCRKKIQSLFEERGYQNENKS